MEQVTQIKVDSRNHVGFSYVVEIGRTMQKINGKWIQVYPCYIHTMPEVVSPDTEKQLKEDALKQSSSIEWFNVEEQLEASRV